MGKIKVAIIGSGNIGTDLMIKVMRNAKHLEMGVFVGIDPNSDGLARAHSMGVSTTHEGIEGLLNHPLWPEIGFVFDATSAKAHILNYDKIRAACSGNSPTFEEKRVIDLTPAAIGPFMVPPVNFDSLADVPNVNMVTCGGQATIPIVAAVNRVTKVHYGEIVASIASKSAGPGTRVNIDEFTKTTAHAIEQVGGASKGKAIIILNPAEPPMVMRDTVFTLSDLADTEAIRKSITAMVADVQQYVPGYQLHQEIQFEEIKPENAVFIEGLGKRSGLKTTVMLQVRGAGHYLPEYAGNLDIMTSAALATAERMAERMAEKMAEPMG